MWLVPLAAAPGVTVAATAAERRYGASVAGWLGAAPLTLAISVLGVAAELGDGAAAVMARNAAGHVAAQVAFAVAFALVLRRFGGRAGLACGVLAFAAVSAVVLVTPAALAVAAAVPALAAGPRVLAGAADPLPGGAGPRTGEATAVGALAALALVSASLLAAALAGPAMAGTLGAFPMQSTAFVALMVRHRGRRAAVGALRGLIHGLPGYLTFCVALSLAAPHTGAVLGTAVAVPACAATTCATWRLVRPARR